MKKRTNRIWEIDFLRGLSILLMVFDHFMYYLMTIPYIFSNYHNAPSFIETLVKFANNYWNSSLRFYGHIVFVTIFLLLVGISCHFSKNNLKRGLQIFGVGVLISIVTFILAKLGFDDVFILFGILHLIGTGILLSCLLELIPGNKLWFVSVGVIIFMIGLNYNMYYPQGVNDIKDVETLIEVLIGLKAFGADSFGLFFVGLIFIGVFIGKTIYDNRKSLLPFFDGKWNKPICFVGRNTLVVYVVSPVILYVLIFIVCLCSGLRL
ncbi:MAG: heparan-alpha-glucosaminide N-acetyltransferase domain-containing protein [Bacilli bacterium]|nr:heparan-alpha-glucosaminide N-acetyltransferase domain-containing protein [Bacilli bacterium]